MPKPFNSIYAHGFIRAAVCIPGLRVADPTYNVERTLALADQASKANAAVAIFPELGLSAYSNDDLFHQGALLDASLRAVGRVVEASRSLQPILVVGAPLRIDGRLFNCGVVIYRGCILGVVPKSYLPNYREYYEKRQFAAARDAVRSSVVLLGQEVPFGSQLIFEAGNLDGFLLGVEICEDVWSAVPPSTWLTLAGATVIANLSASNITIGKAETRRSLCSAHSAKCLAAYLYSGAGPGESTTDIAWDGHALVYESGELLAESTRFAPAEQLVVADIDLERLLQERMRVNTHADTGSDYRAQMQNVRRVRFQFVVPEGEIPLNRKVARFPFVPSNAEERNNRCYEAYNIQVHGLVKRLTSTGISKVVIGVSGGLDSAQALIVAAKTMDRMGLPRTNIMAYTLPGFATSDHTKKNAWALMQALGVTAREIDIRPSCMQMFRDVGHPFAQGKPVYDVNFENVQAGERTSHLFRLAGVEHALVLGTGDLSEAALGWMTYGVGDQMSHYNVNVSVPKTLIQYLIRWVISSGQFDRPTNVTLQEILETEISPELVPHATGDSTRPAQKTAEVVGPYELQDFNLYFLTRHGLRPSKVAFLSLHAWGEAERGEWPESLPKEKRMAYDLPTIKHWLEVFLVRFFKTSQFKRSAMPNGPKVGSGGSLSPRGDWRAPSDAEAEAWLEELRGI
jgi:NAD+ synthase (glutamine-hydrolysing)